MTILKVLIFLWTGYSYPTTPDYKVEVSFRCELDRVEYIRSDSLKIKYPGCIEIPFWIQEKGSTGIILNLKEK